MSNRYLEYDYFINKYKFSHMIIRKKEWLYKKVLDDPNYKIIYKENKYAVFKRIKK